MNTITTAQITDIDRDWSALPMTEAEALFCFTEELGEIALATPEVIDTLAERFAGTDVGDRIHMRYDNARDEVDALMADFLAFG